jgi:hypothetical protein
MYVEAVAMLPQLYMFQRQATDEGGTIEVLPLHNMFYALYSAMYVYGRGQ